MVLTADSFKLECNCGKEHNVDVERVVIDSGSLYGLEDEMAKVGLNGKPVFVYDNNTYEATAGRRPNGQEIILLGEPGQMLKADEQATQLVLEQAAGADVLVGIGSGVICDITRYCAHKMGVPFASSPTAASVDGFTSSLAAINVKGFKLSLPAAAPRLIVADTDVFSKAPMRMTRSGFGDMMGKVTALFEWELAHNLTGEYYCPSIAKITSDAVQSIIDTSADLVKGDKKAFENLMHGLVLSGIAMQLAGNSRPASGAEHHFSHIIEMGIYGDHDTLHGEKVGVGTLCVMRAFEQFLNLSADEVREMQRPYTALDANKLRAVFGDLTDSIMAENEKDCLKAVADEDPAAHWDDIKAMYAKLPTRAEMNRLFEGIGAINTVEGIDMDPKNVGQVLFWSPPVRNRLTLMRIITRRLCGSEYDFRSITSM